MHKFMEPDSVALIGVPRRTGTGAFNNAEIMHRYGFRGRIYPINPKTKDIYGLKTYPSVLELPEIVDLAIISVGRERVLPMFEQCIQASIKRVLIISQGFSDADAQGAALEKKIVELAKKNQVRVIGPNTLGIINNYRCFTTAFIDIVRPEVFSPISVIAQTGLIQVASTNISYHNWGKAIDIGNGCDVDFVDALSYLEADPQTRIIVIHMEGIKRGREFLNIAKRITREKPIVVFKAGRSKTGAKAALSHTGSLVGEDHVFDAAFKRAGLIRVKNATELKIAVHALLLLEEMPGPRLGILTLSGAGGIMGADACADFNLVIASLPQSLIDNLKQGIHEWINISNPMDIWPVGITKGNYAEVYRIALTELLATSEVDGVLTIFLASNSPIHADLDFSTMAAAACQDSRSKKPLAAWSYVDAATATQKLESIHRVACFETIEEAVQGLSFCYQYHQIKHRKSLSPKSFQYERDQLQVLLNEGRSKKVLTGQKALQLIGLFGIPIVHGAVADNLEQLMDAANRLTYPLVLKLNGKPFIHKTEWGGVITGIRNSDELQQAFDRIIENVHNRDSKIKIDSYQLQEQAEGKELLLGLTIDSQFGHVIACGSGGIYTEVFNDISREIVPVDNINAEKMIKSLKIYPVLKGTRGESGIDLNSLIETIERLSFLVTTIPDIAEVDINPLKADIDGCMAVDARILWE